MTKQKFTEKQVQDLKSLFNQYGVKISHEYSDMFGDEFYIDKQPQLKYVRLGYSGNFYISTTATHVQTYEEANKFAQNMQKYTQLLDLVEQILEGE